jgi:3-oxoacyl-[acyl-carrier-protein] synthase II
LVANVVTDRNRVSIAISGLGLVTSLGLDFSESFRNLCAGHSGVRPVHMSLKDNSTEIVGFPVDQSRLKQDVMWNDPVFWILDHALGEAIERSKLDFKGVSPERIAVIVGLSKGAIRLKSRWADDIASIAQDPLARSLGWAGIAPSAGATFVASRIGATGPVLAPISACATGMTCVRVASDLLSAGLCDVAIAGAADASLIPMIDASFRRMKALASATPLNEPSDRWIRPWSSSRNGFLIGEGGALFVLERLPDLTASGRKPRAVVTGFASGSEAYHATRPHPSADSLRRVLADSIGPDRVLPDVVHLHATATRDYDALEANAVRETLGSSHANTYVMASKPGIGHCLGAAGAVELAIACGALEHEILPPFSPQPPFDFEPVGNTVGPVALAYRAKSILKIVAGFGGHIEACILTRTCD